MKKKLTKEHKRKMMEGKKKIRGLIWKINNNASVYSDSYQYILTAYGHVTYHPSLPMVLDELLDMRQKRKLVRNKSKDITGVLNALKEARQWMEEIVKPILGAEPTSR